MFDLYGTLGKTSAERVGLNFGLFPDSPLDAASVANLASAILLTDSQFEELFGYAWSCLISYEGPLTLNEELCLTSNSRRIETILRDGEEHFRLPVKDVKGYAIETAVRSGPQGRL